MNILIISTSDERKRYLFISEPLDKIKNIKTYVFKNESNILIYIFESLLYAYRKRDFSYVIILGGDFKCFLWLLLTKFFMKSKTVLRLGGDPFEVRKKTIKNALTKKEIVKYLKLILNYIFTKIVFYYADTFVVVNQSLVSSINRYTKHNKKIYIIPQPVKLDRLTNIKSNEYKRNFNLLTVTNLSYQDKYIGVRNIIEYLVMYIHKHNFNFTIEYNILGGGYYIDDLKLFLKSNNVKSKYFHINVHGYIDNPSDFYKNADIFIYYSTLDSTPNVLLEAQSYGLPLLVNSYEPFYHILQKDKNALFFDENISGDFYVKLLKLIENDLLRKEIGEKNIDNIKKNFSISSISRKWESFLVAQKYL
jgi:glycosyltransferase involved in cell wall biosynthesis